MSRSRGRDKSDREGPKRLPTRAEAIRLLREAGATEPVIAHCRAVSSLAVKMAKRCSAPVDLKLVEIGALLHDIGRSKAHGISHGVEGARIARRLGLPGEAIRIIERHLGAGIPKEDAERLGLPKRNLIPRSIEEKIVAHADNLIDGRNRAPVAVAIARLVRLREEAAAKRMLALHEELSALCGVNLDLI